MSSGGLEKVLKKVILLSLRADFLYILQYETAVRMKVSKGKTNLCRVSSQRSTMWSVVGVVVARTVVVAARCWVVVWIVVGWGVRAGLRPRGRTILPDMGAHWWHSVVSCAQVAPNYAHRTRWRLDLRFTKKRCISKTENLVDGNILLLNLKWLEDLRHEFLNLFLG